MFLCELVAETRGIIEGMETDMDAREVQEGQMVQLVRNALLVAGQEMGTEGDHWPVINATVHQIMRDWEEVKLERAADAEMKIHLYEQLAIMERGLPECEPDVQAELRPRLQELREVYDAYFAPTDGRLIALPEDGTPAHIKRARAIISTLEADDE